MIIRLSDNVIVIANKQSSNIYYLDYGGCKILIDTGHYLERDEILSDMRNANIDIHAIDYLLLTHAHTDHIGNCAYLHKCNNAHIVVSDNHACFQKRLAEFNAVECIDSIAEPYQSDMTVRNGSRIPLNDTQYLEVILTPGHTADSISF